MTAFALGFVLFGRLGPFPSPLLCNGADVLYEVGNVFAPLQHRVCGYY